ncbi:MAG: type II CRISPR-associated endonuclease Cas1 [Candidatus Cloacimonadia bacterium]|jgi:CRISPR-associated protein Cas1
MSIIEIDRNGITLSVRGGFLEVREKDKKEDVPLSDIDCVILNSYGATVSNRSLIRLCELNIPLLLCGNNSMPIGILLSTVDNVYRKERVTIQTSVKPTLRKTLWQQIIKQKIIHQAYVLKKNEAKHKDLLFLAEKVQPGDITNSEATAARFYWKRLFGEDFIRDYDLSGINSFLNYGYAIIRATTCRNIAAAGLLPELGLHHHNQMNPFCLADDLLEPYRPYIDDHIKQIKTTPFPDLTPETKRYLISILDKQVMFNDNKTRIRNAVNLTVQSLVKSFKEKKNLIAYPEFNE